MKKILLNIISPLIALPFLASCSLFGGTTKKTTTTEEEYNITYVSFKSVRYCNAGAVSDDLERGEFLGYITSSGSSTYTLRFYSIENEDKMLIGILTNGTTYLDYERVFVTQDAGNIPAEYLDEFPQKTIWDDEWSQINVNGDGYLPYGTFKTGLSRGSYIGSYDGIKYYEVIGYDDWICRINDEDFETNEIFYKATTQYLPAQIVWGATSL